MEGLNLANSNSNNLEIFFSGLIFVDTTFLWYLGNRTSVASSTDTGDDHDTDIEDPLPLPPPRPRHWAKRAKEQSMRPDCNSSDTVKLDYEHSKTDNASDWSRSIPQFPLPTFQSTMQSKLWTVFWILYKFADNDVNYRSCIIKAVFLLLENSCVMMTRRW